MGTLLNRRRYMGEVGEPVMRYVQYIEATNGQYLDTGITPDSSSEITIDGDFAKLDGTSSFFSACTTWNFSQYTLFLANNRLYWAVRNANFTMTLQRYTYKIVGSTLYMDDVQKGTNTWNNNYVNTTFHIFAHGSAGTAGVDRRNSNGKLYGVTHKKNDILLQNLVPVAIGNVGYMLDTLTDTLFASGSGDFKPGPDIT